MLVSQAGEISRLTEGMYDVTVGPLVELWGFGSKGGIDTPPPPSAIAQMLPRVGYRKLAIRQNPPALKKTNPALHVDLSSIAKGWAVDEIAALLEAHGYTDYLVDIGGDLRAAGRHPGGRPWRIAVEKPVREARAVQRLIDLDGLAMATSGDYRNFFRDGAQFYTHTIDPSTGYPVQHRLASVTVLADHCASADAWATALLALGEAQGPALAEREGLKALFIERTNDGFREHVTSALTALSALE